MQISILRQQSPFYLCPILQKASQRGVPLILHTLTTHATCVGKKKKLYEASYFLKWIMEHLYSRRKKKQPLPKKTLIQQLSWIVGNHV